MFPRIFGHSRPYRRPDPTAWFVGAACTLVFGLFIAMTAGGALVGYFRQEGPACPPSCR